MTFPERNTARVGTPVWMDGEVIGWIDHGGWV